MTEEQSGTTVAQGETAPPQKKTVFPETPLGDWSKVLVGALVLLLGGLLASINGRLEKHADQAQARHEEMINQLHTSAAAIRADVTTMEKQQVVFNTQMEERVDALRKAQERRR